jgi:glycine/D-amino acid oxidase-like deaminating enzyme
MEGKYDLAIIGGGVYGLSIAYNLAKSQKKVALFERYHSHYVRYTLGHGNGSSHGPQRITRSVY